MRLLWTAGDRMILFGFRPGKLPEMNGLYLIAKPVRGEAGSFARL